MITIENKLTGEHCINQVKALRSAYLSESELKCRNCSGLNKECENYRPVKFYSIPLNNLRFRT